MVGGVDVVVGGSLRPSVCGCRAKASNLLKSNSSTLSVHLELSACDLKRKRRRQSLSVSERYRSLVVSTIASRTFRQCSEPCGSKVVTTTRGLG